MKALGVGVLFMNDGINTLDPDSELRLSIMGSIAQEESRKTSARVKWGPKMVVHPNRRVEIKLNLLPPSWAYVLALLEELRRLKAAENEGCHNNSSVSPLFDTVSHNLPAEKPLRRNDFSGRCHNDPSVPISVSRPFSSSKGIL